MPNRFELKQLREAAEKYAYHDAGTHGVWPRLVWEGRNESQVARIDDSVEFLGKWKALRFKGGGAAFRRICTTWLRRNLTDLERLRGRVLPEISNFAAPKRWRDKEQNEIRICVYDFCSCSNLY